MSESNDHDPFDIDRERGIFTKADREYIIGERELSDQAERNTRFRIRNRLRNAIHDLGLISAISLNDRKQVSQKLFPLNAQGERVLHRCLDALFRLSVDTEQELDDRIDNAAERWSNVLESVVKYYIKDHSDGAMVDVGVDISIDISHPDHDELFQKYRNNEENYEEFQYLQNNRLIETDRTFWNHLFRHRWENGRELTIYSPEGEIMTLSPSDFDSLGEFQKRGMDSLSKFGHIDGSDGME